MAKKKGFLSVSVLAAFSKRLLGVGSRLGVSPYALACEALIKDGMTRPSDMTDKQWLHMNAAYIRNMAKGLPKAARVPKREYVATDAFLSSYEWRKVRMQALKKYGPKCMCCGATPATGAVMNVDHIKPRKLFPSLALDVSNLQILCHDCNHGKGNWDTTDWRPS